MSEERPQKLGRYEVVRELGKGAMGVVYEGVDPNIGRQVAIKTARRDVLEQSGRAGELMERFLREARAMGGVNHPNVLTIYDADEQDDMAYIAMEFLTGGDLEHWIAKQPSIDPADAVEICAKVASALNAVHDHNIVHRDIKPANVMVLDNGEIKVADFGIAHVSDSNLTQEGSMIGTPHYMSPEQFQGKKIDGRSDLWAVGVMLYEMLTKEKPFDGDSLTTVMTRCMRSNPIPPHELDVTVPEALSMVCMKSLSKSPNSRYQTGEDFAAAMREALKETPDPKVLKLGAAMDATVVGGDAEDTGEATMITGSEAGLEVRNQTTAIQLVWKPVLTAIDAILYLIFEIFGTTFETIFKSSERLAASVSKSSLMASAAAVVVVVLAGGLVGWAIFGGGGVPSYTAVKVDVRKIDDPRILEQVGTEGFSYSQLERAQGAVVIVEEAGSQIGTGTIDSTDEDLQFSLNQPAMVSPKVKATLNGYEEDQYLYANRPTRSDEVLEVPQPLVLIKEGL